MKKVVIVAAKRTAIGSFLGSLSGFKAPELSALLIKNILEETKVPQNAISEVILGNVLIAGVGQNPARQAAIAAGIDKSTPAVTINQVCGSGLKAVELAAQAIMLGDADVVMAGGQENMSQAPHLLANVRNGIRIGNSSLVDSMVYDGLTDIYNQYHMGITAENIVKQYNISRLEQDEFALHSQHKAEQATKHGKFNDEIVPITIPQKKGDPLIFAQDEFVRMGLTLDNLAKLRPAFAKDGTVTAGNASGVNDGAAVVLLMSEAKAKFYGLEPLGYINAYTSVGLNPEVMGLGPVDATHKVLKLANLELKDLGLIEANEAFAAQALGVNKLLGWDTSRVNVNGGAIALGHPIGASGCRILVTLLHEMKRQQIKHGLATLCIGGGMGTALVVSRPMDKPV